MALSLLCPCEWKCDNCAKVVIGTVAVTPVWPDLKLTERTDPPPGWSWNWLGRLICDGCICG